MFGLLPAEHWDFKTSDLARGMAASLDLAKLNGMIDIRGIGSCFPSRSGRSAIVAAIRVLRLSPGAHIGVPLYSCPVVFKAIKEAGCKANFIDMDPDKYCLSVDDLVAKKSKIDALIVIHMFGNMCDMPAVLEVAKGMPIIEDCAQSLGSRLDGRMAGSFGTIAVLSFRSGKYLSVGEGGALYSSDKEIRSRLMQLTSELPVPSRSEECIHVAKTYLRSRLRSRPLYGILGYPLWHFYNKKVDYTAKTPIVNGRIFKSDLSLTCHRLKFIDKAIQKQRLNADYLSGMLHMDSNMLCSEKAGTFYNRYLYPIKFPSSKHRDLMADYLHSRRIDTIKPYQDIAEIAAAHYGYKGDCPVTETVSKKLLAIPSYFSLRKRDLERIAQAVNSGWDEIKDFDNTLRNQ